MSLWDALRMNMMISYQELVRTFLIIPEIILRVCTSEQLGRLSDFTSLGVLLNPLLSLLIFLALLSIILAVIAIALVKRLLRTR